MVQVVEGQVDPRSVSHRRTVLSLACPGRPFPPWKHIGIKFYLNNCIHTHCRIRQGWKRGLLPDKDEPRSTGSRRTRR